MFWKVSWLGNPVKWRKVAEVIRNKKIDIVYLEETKFTDPNNRDTLLYYTLQLILFYIQKCERCFEGHPDWSRQ